MVAFLIWLMTGIVGANETVEITLWHHWDGERMGLVQKVLDDFMEENPHIVVHQMLSPPTSNADRLIAFVLGGSAPEIVMVSSSFAIQIANMGGFMALDDLVDRDQVDLGMFNDADLQGFQLHGKTYALPVMSGIAWTNLLFYNKELMNAAGLDAESPPTTWEQWREASLRMTRRSGEGVLSQIGSHMPGVLEAAYWNGADLWGSDWRTAHVVDERIEEAAMFLQELIAAQAGSWPEYNAFWGSGFNSAFYRGQAGFWRQNSSAFSHLKNFDIDWGAALAPASGFHDDARPVGLVESTWAYAIPAFLPAEKVEATWKLLTWLTTHEEAAGWFARVQGRPSPVTAFNGHRDYLHENQYWSAVIESAQFVEFAPPVNLSPLRGHLNAMMRGDVHPQQGMEAAELALQNELNRYWQTLE